MLNLILSTFEKNDFDYFRLDDDKTDFKKSDFEIVDDKNEIIKVISKNTFYNLRAFKTVKFGKTLSSEDFDKVTKNLSNLIQ